MFKSGCLPCLSSNILLLFLCNDLYIPFQLELALMVEKLQELRSIRIQKLKKQGKSLGLIFILVLF